MASVPQQSWVNEREAFFVKAHHSESNAVKAPFKIYDNNPPFENSYLNFSFTNDTGIIGLVNNNGTEDARVTMNNNNVRIATAITPSGSVYTNATFAGPSNYLFNTTNFGANNAVQISQDITQNGQIKSPNAIQFITGNTNSNIRLNADGSTTIPNLITGGITAPSLNTSSIVCSTITSAGNVSFGGSFTASNGGSVYGAGLGVSGTLSVNNGINMDQGTTLTGPGTITMKNSGGFYTGTIEGLASIPMAGFQPITITGYNPSNPTPTITLGPYGTITTSNSASASYIGGVGMGVNYNGVFAPGGIDITAFKNLYILDCTSPSNNLARIGNPATASILIGNCYFVFGNNAGNVFDFNGCPTGSVYAFFLLTGENNHGMGLVYWNGGTNPATSITWNSFGAGGGAQGPSGGSYSTSISPLTGDYSRWDYTYSGHASSGYGGVIMFRII